VWITPGIFFGPAGESHIRASITLPTDELREAMDRLQALKL
jgi:aspartate/methionine/tyrosine aminotransferase